MYNTKEKIKGALFGVAVGDALGAPVEFMSDSEIRETHGQVRDMLGGGRLNVKPGEITDDTQMTLAVAHGIVERPSDPVEAIGTRFIKWILSGPKDVGGTCSASIHGAMSLSDTPHRPTTDDWNLASYSTHKHMGNRSAGNGSLMRTVYVGLYYNTVAEIASHAMDISRMTHFDPVAAYDCATYSILIHNLINSTDSHRSIISNTIKTYFDSGSRYDCAALARKSFKPNPSGYVVDSFAAALHCILTTGTFEDALIKAVNLGGDADTIGAITGGIAGAIYGFRNIPERWWNILDFNVSRELKILADIAVDNQKQA